MTTPTLWHGCYDDSWKGVIVDDAFAHPAKFAPGLIKRILTHGLALGHWRAGDLIGDPFGGIAGGGIMAGFAGLDWIGVELEPHFVAMGNRNIKMNQKYWAARSIRLVQGDSRRFASIVGNVGGAVLSPPFGTGDSAGPESLARRTDKSAMAMKNIKAWNCGQGQSSPGNIAGLSAGISSPPYAEAIRGDHGETESAAESLAARRTPGGSLGQSQRSGGYGASAGNIGNLKEGVCGVVTSPPYSDTSIVGGKGYKDNWRKYEQNYGNSAGQIGHGSGETYWQAMRLVYEQCRLAIKPGGYMAVVMKDYVKNKARVPLVDETWRLLAACGFEAVARVRAMLVKESTRVGLFATETKRTERKSFFRRLAEKNGSPRIDWEEVLFVRKPIH